MSRRLCGGIEQAAMWWGGGLVGYVNIVSPPVPIGLGIFTSLGLGLGLGIGGRGLGLGLDKYIKKLKKYYE